MSLMPLLKAVSSKYIIGLLNSNLIFDYYRDFVNCTVNIQINDLRQLPIIVPSTQQLTHITLLVNKAIQIKKSASERAETDDAHSSQLPEIEQELDNIVSTLYCI